MELEIIEDEFAICKINDLQEIDFSDEFCFVGKTDEELSLVCTLKYLPENYLECNKGWRGFRIQEKLEFNLIGIISKISSILSEAQIGIFAVSTYDTDYILIKKEHFQRALEILKIYGYGVQTETAKIKVYFDTVERTEEMTEKLMSLWEGSVWATHAFLSKEDIDELNPWVKESIKHIKTLYVMEDKQGNYKGFAGAENKKIEMLFMDAANRGGGYGKQLLRYVMEQEEIQYVDVNEQNPLAMGFYCHMGFQVFDKVETDGQGRKRPILKMQFAGNVR